ncbi:MAG: hypothetical protein AB7N76_26590 [Planctomycetota bacterium]
MTRVVNKRELARLLGVAEREVDPWIREGCPCFRIRHDLDLFHEQEVRAWFERRQVEAIKPVLSSVLAASTPADVAAIARELPGLVARGVISRDGAQEINHHLLRLARKLAEDRRRRP